MDLTLPIPGPDPLPLPGPEPLIHGLLVLTFLLHALFMNLVLGGTPIMVITEWLGLRTNQEPYRRLAATLANLLPNAMALTVVLGVAPLLFLQVLYGQFFYTATILIGDTWIVLIGVLILAYYGLYAYKYAGRWWSIRPGVRLSIGAACAVLFFGVALVFVTMSVVVITPERWQDIRDQGFWFATDLQSVLPRYLHMVLAALAGSGMLLTLYGCFLESRWAARFGAAHEDLPEYGIWMTKYGVGWTLTATLPQVLVGPWLLLTIPGPARAALVTGGGTTSLVFFTALSFALLALVLLNASLLATRVQGLALGAVGCLTLTVGLMVLVRDRVRHYALAPHFDPATMTTQPQWDLIWLFGGLLLVGLLTVGYLLGVTVRARRTGSAP